MADNLTFTTTVATAPSGTVVATDDVGGAHYPYGKVVFGADGTATLVTATVGLPVGDAGGSLTVDAPVGTPVFVRLSDGSSAITTLPVSLASVPSHAVTNTGTFAVQVDGSALTSLQLLDDAVVADDAAFTPATTKVIMAGFEYDDTTPDSVDEGDAGAARMSARREVYVQLRDAAGNERGLNVDGSGYITVNVNGTVTVGSHAVTNAGTFAVQAAQSGTWTVTGTGGTFPVTDSSGSLTVDAPVGTPVFVRLSDGSSAISTLPVSLASVPSHAVTNAGTFAVQVDGTALTRLTDIETNTDSGAVVGNGAAATAQRVTLANDSTGIVALTTSTASIGKLAANSGVDIGDVDVTSIATGTNAIGRVGHDTTGLGHGVTTVTTAGTDVVLASSTACKWIIVQSQTDNTGLIAVGASGVDATEATGTGIILYPGQSVTILTDNLADLYIDSTVSGEGVRYTYGT